MQWHWGFFSGSNIFFNYLPIPWRLHRPINFFMWKKKSCFPLKSVKKSMFYAKIVMFLKFIINFLSCFDFFCKEPQLNVPFVIILSIANVYTHENCSKIHSVPQGKKRRKKVKKPNVWTCVWRLRPPALRPHANVQR